MDSKRGSTPWLQDPDVTLYHGDVLATLRELPAESVDCVVTSPPYWGLRDYGTGEWGGGDAECDHKGEPLRTSAYVNANWDGGNDIKNAEKFTPMRDVCSKCGARRIDQQLGLEATPEQYVERMVEVFREVRRVLAAHGTVWLNLGDSYSGGKTDRDDNDINRRNENGPASTRELRKLKENPQGRQRPVPAGLKPKDLVGIPWRVAFALQTDGWYLRSDVIWAKPNPMPESVTDRPTKAHEYVFLLSKQPRYFFDQEAVREKAEWARWGDQTVPKHEGTATGAGWIKGRPKHELQRPQARRAMELFEQAGLTDEHLEAIRAVGITDTGKATVTQNGTGHNTEDVQRLAQEAKDVLGGYYREFLVPNGRNIRSVWEIATQPYPEAHFATFPEELARRCIAAGCPEQVCRVCGRARERVILATAADGRSAVMKGGKAYDENGEPLQGDNMIDHGVRGSWNSGGALLKRKTAGFTDCGHADYRPGIVLDPFMGSGTVAFVARKLGRHAIGIDLNESYLQLAAKRLQQQSLFAEVPGGL